MHRAAPNSDGPSHQVPAGATLRTSPPLLAPARPLPPSSPLPARPTLLPLSFVLLLIAVVAFGSASLALAGAYFIFDPHPAAAQAAPVPVETKAVAVETPRAEPVKEPPPAADTLAVLPFEMLFEPTPALRREVEKLNDQLPQLLADEGKLRVKPLAETASLRYCRDPLAAAHELKVRAVLVVKFTTQPGHNDSTCHLELIDVVSGFLLWGTEIEAPDGFLKHPERLAAIRQTIVEQVPKHMAPQQ